MKFSEIFTVLRNYLGGGYFHPWMYIANPIKFNRYENSGETMYDIDLKNGGSINTGVPGRKFWDLIHGADAEHKWNWGYMGGELAPQLMSLASQMIYPEYKLLCNSLLHDAAQNIISCSAKLTTIFLYTTYNGAGWFRYFAGAINIYVDRQGITDPDILAEKMIQERRTLDPKMFSANAISLIEQGADTLEKILPSITGEVEFDIN